MRNNMTETEINNWQIRINVFENTNHTIEIVEAIENLKLGYDIRLLNIDKDEGEDDDKTQIKCNSCGQLDGALHNYVCDTCLILEKEQRQKEHDEKYDDDKRGVDWDWVAHCPECGLPAAYDSDECYWYCPHGNCTNYLPDRSVNANEFDARETTQEELAELKKTYPFAEWI